MTIQMRTIAITGASSGLGAELARRYAAPGMSLNLAGRRLPQLMQVAEDCRALGAAVVVKVLDVSNGDELADWLQGIDSNTPIDLLIANAGICGGSPDQRATEGRSLAARVITTNFLGVVHALETVAPLMLARGRGQLVVIASTAAFRGMPYMPAYSGSKAGVRVYAEGLRALLRPSGVAVTVVCPGFFSSPMTDNFDGPKLGLWKLEAAARLIVRGIERRAPRVVFPLGIARLMQFLDLAPPLFADALLRQNKFVVRPAAAADRVS